MEKSLGSSLQITSQSEIPTHFTTQMRTSKIQIESMTPVAGPIFRGGNLSPILQGRFCKPYPADFVG